MPLDKSQYQPKKATPSLPELNAFPPSPQEPVAPDYRGQNLSAIALEVAEKSKDAVRSLQELDDKLAGFESRFADAAIDRIDSMPVRIEQKIAQGLEARQKSRQKADLGEVYALIDSLVIPGFPMGVTAMGALSAGY